MSIVDYSEFDASTIKFGAARKNKSGGTAIYLSDAEGQRVRLQFPFLRCPFGLGEYTDKDTKKVSYSIDLALDVAGHVADAVDIGDGGSAEFHYKTRHEASGYP